MCLSEKKNHTHFITLTQLKDVVNLEYRWSNAGLSLVATVICFSQRSWRWRASLPDLWRKYPAAACSHCWLPWLSREDWQRKQPSKTMWTTCYMNNWAWKLGGLSSHFSQEFCMTCLFPVRGLTLLLPRILHKIKMSWHSFLLILQDFKMAWPFPTRRLASVYVTGLLCLGTRAVANTSYSWLGKLAAKSCSDMNDLYFCQFYGALAMKYPVAFTHACKIFLSVTSCLGWAMWSSIPNLLMTPNWEVW